MFVVGLFVDGGRSVRLEYEGICDSMGGACRESDDATLGTYSHA